MERNPTNLTFKNFRRVQAPLLNGTVSSFLTRLEILTRAILFQLKTRYNSSHESHKRMFLYHVYRRKICQEMVYHNVNHNVNQILSKLSSVVGR